MAAPSRPVQRAEPPFAKGSIIWEKKGPLPVWAWALLVLGLLLAWTIWRRNRAESNATAEVTGDSNTLPGDQTPPIIFNVPQAATPAVNVTVPVTVPTAPPAGGSPPPSTPPPTPNNPAPAPPGGFVAVTKYPDSTRPKESTLWDIAGSWLPQGAGSWQLIWNHPLNADIRKRRGDPKRIQAGDRFFVPGKLASPR